MELARTEDEQDECAGDLEDGFYQSEQDKKRGARLLEQGALRLKQARNPCGFFKRVFKPKECIVNDL